MNVLKFIPLLMLSALAYHLLVAIGQGTPQEIMATQLVTIPLVAAQWVVTVSDLLILVSLILLYVELFKATRTDKSSIIDHGLSMMLFVVMLIDFIVVGVAGTSTFLILTMLALLDVVAGFTISISVARRDFAVDHG